MVLLKNKRIIVTGGAGFLGSHVVRLLLEKNNDVVVLDNFSNGKAGNLEDIKNNPNLKIIKGDITNTGDVDNAFKGCQVVIHLAVACLRHSIKDPKRVNEIITDGTINCLNAALANKVELFLNCSSPEAFGSARNATPMNEEHSLNPMTPYGVAKAAQDLYVMSYGKTYGLPWAIIRPFNMYGPTSHWAGARGELIPKMIVRAMNNQPLVIFGDGSQTRDFVYVEDAAQAIIAVTESPNCLNESVNFCTGKETSVQRIAEIICKYLELDPKKVIQKYPARPGDVARHIGDNSKFKRLLGFTPKTDIEEGIQRTISWFKSLPLTPEEMLSQEKLENWQ